MPSGARCRPRAWPGSLTPVVGVTPWRTSSIRVGRGGVVMAGRSRGPASGRSRGRVYPLPAPRATIPPAPLPISRAGGPMDATDLCYTPATELAALIRGKTLSPVELTRAVLERIERVNPAVNAFCTVTADLAMAAARRAEDQVARGAPLGALHGLPVSIKDLTLTRGIPSMAGSRIFAT